MPRDLHNLSKFSRALAPVAATTDNTAYVSTILDTANFDANELVLLLGSLADADATFTSLFEEGDDSNLSDAAAVSSTDCSARSPARSPPAPAARSRRASRTTTPSARSATRAPSGTSA
jgi:hypothetical protein